MRGLHIQNIRKSRLFRWKDINCDEENTKKISLMQDKLLGKVNVNLWVRTSKWSVTLD
jgi:hypothetical protein